MTAPVQSAVFALTKEQWTQIVLRHLATQLDLKGNFNTDIQMHPDFSINVVFAQKLLPVEETGDVINPELS